MPALFHSTCLDCSSTEWSVNSQRNIFRITQFSRPVSSSPHPRSSRRHCRNAFKGATWRRECCHSSTLLPPAVAAPARCWRAGRKTFLAQAEPFSSFPCFQLPGSACYRTPGGRFCSLHKPAKDVAVVTRGVHPRLLLFATCLDPAMAMRAPWVAARRWLSRGKMPELPNAGRGVNVAELLQNAMVEEGEGAEERDDPRVRRDPNDVSVLLFPGQGSQFVGMSRGLLHYPKVRELFRVAEEVLGYDLLRLCLEGPKAELDRTVHSQPAVFVSSLAAVEKLFEQQPTVIENCVAAAGFSIGEYAALVFAGAIDYAEALYAVKVRAEAMQEASEAVPSGMLSVIGKANSNYVTACLEAREYCNSLGIKNSVCAISNYLFPDSRVIAGHLQALEFLQKNSKKYSFVRVKMLPVSGAFHTELMESALEPLSEALKSIEIRQPLIPVYSNVDSQKYRQPKRIRHLLAKQLVSPVKWEQTMHAIYERKKGISFPYTYEVGPGKQLGTILKSCNLKAWAFYKNVDVTEDVSKQEKDP